MENLREHTKPLRYFIVPGESPAPVVRHRERVRAAFLTSFRDLAEEGVGKRVEHAFGQEDYTKGTLEYAVEQATRGKLAHCLEIALVIYDDTQKDLDKLGNPLPLRPERGKPWIHPLNLRTKEGELVTSITRNLPSRFRQMPLSDTEGRATEKRRYEDTIRRLMDQYGAQILISDHYLCRVQHLLDPRHSDLPNRILNTHPGISDRRHRFRLPGNDPYVDAIKRAKTHPWTGASHHIMTPEIDDGPVVVDFENTPILETDPDDWLKLCRRNYRQSKNTVFGEGLFHYITYLYPRINHVNLHALEPLEAAESIYQINVA